MDLCKKIMKNTIPIKLTAIVFYAIPKAVPILYRFCKLLIQFKGGLQQDTGYALGWSNVNHRARRKRYTLITKLRIANWGRESRTGTQWFNFLEFLVCLLIGSTVS